MTFTVMLNGQTWPVNDAKLADAIDAEFIRLGLDGSYPHYGVADFVWQLLHTIAYTPDAHGWEAYKDAFPAGSNVKETK